MLFIVLILKIKEIFEYVPININTNKLKKNIYILCNDNFFISIPIYKIINGQ